jgi:tetratricopeptide (TPR) repeat protein
LEFFGQALAIAKALSDRALEGQILNNLGVVYQILGDYPKALELYQQALAVLQDIRMVAEANLGDVYLAQGRLQEAQALFQRLNDPIRLGRYYLHMKDYWQAQEEFTSSLPVLEAQRRVELLLADYIGLGLAHEGLKKYAKARDYYRKAVDFIERQREALIESQRRQFFGAKVQGFSRLEPYEGLARVSVYLQDAAEGLYWAEHTKARLLLEALARHGMENTLGLPQELAQEERDLSNRLTVTYKQMDIAFEKKNTERYRELEQELPKLKKDQDAFIARLRKDYPDYAAIRYPQPVRVEALKLGPNEVLIEYEVTEAATFA